MLEFRLRPSTSLQRHTCSCVCAKARPWLGDSLQACAFVYNETRYLGTSLKMIGLQRKMPDQLPM